ncbi:MAG TPA: protease modulator HflC [Nevskiaceae bacterium]|nr:protease modulator HflC [Nevskiaceae bacterium]
MSNRQLLNLAIVAAIAFAIVSSFFTVEPGERVALFQLGRIQGADYAPGLHTKLPFLQSVTRVDARVMTLEAPAEGYATQEQKSLRIDYVLRWRVADTVAYYRATGGQELSADDLLSALVNRALRDEIGKRSVHSIVGSGEDLSKTLIGALEPKVGELGVGLVDLQLRRVELPEELRDAYYDRMRAERTRVAAERRAKGEEEAEKIRAEADAKADSAVASAYRDAEKLRGEGDAKAAEIYAKAYGQDPDFYAFYRSLNVYRDAFRGDRNVLVLEPKGEFFRYFKQPEPAR